ncbi:hypothetical protein GA0074695_1526 [Micromonospora viridifaciens]|uniref:Uncharacterized protein n=1 Tax=Micromonospora viridifaciens TaxID=1881 RepID=A0A1C4VJE8_MICVI|nr:hypothetical protein [Micromonospora viridifaciens]SCE84086.1 hypothetical protein GA0074695_1526 [Micromonospora viridifaciens]
MATAYDLARELSDLRRRLESVERTAQAPHTSIEGGSLTINDADGLPVVVLGDQGDGTYGVTAYNGATVNADVVSQETLDEIAAELELAEGAVTEALLAAGAVTETKIADNSISSPKVIAGAIQAGHIAAGAIDAGKIVAGAVTADKLAANAVTADKLDANAVTAGKIAAGAVTAGKIATGAITADKLDATAITGKTITGGLFRTAAIGNRLEVGAETYTPTGEAALRWAINTHDWAEPHITAGQGGETPGRYLYLRCGGTDGPYSAVRLNETGGILFETQEFGGSVNRLTLDSAGLTLNGVRMGMGRVGNAQSTANSAAVFAETAVLSITGLTFKANRAYRVRVGGAFTMTTAGIVRARLRNRATDPTTATEWADLGHFPATLANNPFDLSKVVYLRRVAATDLTGQTLALTLQASVAGTIHNGSPTAPRFLEIEDCGAATDYPYAVVI